MAASPLPFVDTADIAELVGRQSLERGRVYADEGFVRELDWDASTFRLIGVVQGTARAPYRCRIELAPGQGGVCRLVASACSCAMRYDCKHVAAALLAASSTYRLVSGAGIGTDEASAGLSRDAGAALSRDGAAGIGADASAGLSRDAGAGSSRDAKVALSGDAGAALSLDRSGWRAALRLLDGREDPPERRPGGKASAAARGGFAPLALAFELREPAHPRSGRSRPGTVPASKGRTRNVRLMVRPAVRSAAGKWVTGGVGWGSLYHQVHRLNLDARQVSWFGQFSALGRSLQGVYFGQDPDRIVVDDFDTPLLWPLLREACDLGIGLVTGKQGDGVRIGEWATVRLDLSASGGSDPRDGRQGGGRQSSRRDIRLEVVTDIDGRRVPANAVHRIGEHGLYAVEWSPDLSITIAPAAAPLTEAVAALLDRGDLTIPAADVDDFLSGYYPSLSRLVPVGSADGSVELPEVRPPVLVAVARFEPGHLLSLRWEWEYRRGEATERIPAVEGDSASDASSRGRERRREDELRARAAEIWETDVSGRRDASNGHDRPGGLDPLAPRSWSGLDAMDVAERILPAIDAREGIRLEVLGTRPEYRELRGEPTLTVTTVESDRRDWFDLGILVSVDGYSVPFGPLFAALSSGKKKLLLVDGSHLSLERPVFGRLKELIDEAGELEEWETGPRISRYQASLWADFEDLADQSEPALSWRQTVGGLLQAVESMEAAEAGEAPEREPGERTRTATPDGLHGRLRPYQRDGFDWLAFLWEHRLGGILADDMGLGKTIQALTLIAHAKETGDGLPFLVVAPTSVVPNWVSEAARFTPGLRVVSLGSGGRRSRRRVPPAEEAEDADIVITSYARFRLDFDAYRSRAWAGLILDEAQFVKNRVSRVHQCARDLPAPFKLAITGTPLENNLAELRALFDIVAPGLFPSARRFTEQYIRPIEHASTRGDAATIIGRLRRRIRPLMLRRTKESVAPELPPKHEQILTVELSRPHRRLYDTFLQRERQKLLGLIDDLDRNRMTVFRSLTLLRMLSLDAQLIDEKYAAIPSSKLEALFEQLDNVIADGHRALVFSQFTSFLRRVGEGLDEKGIPYAYLDGRTRRRAEEIGRFTGGETPLFLISLKAGGFGLNLTEADYVFLLDPWWNPAAEMQAVDRTHRIGQKQRVVVYRLVSAGTIEEKVLALGTQKARLFDAVMEDGADPGAVLTADDIRVLLEER